MSKRLKSRELPYGRRRTEQVEQRKRFLIVCEGEKTEPNYFRAFRVPGRVVDVEGIGGDPMTVVDEALRLRRNGEYEQVWCVFDRDSFAVNRFVGAITRAQAKGMQVAYTNEAFELWYLLHFDYVDSGVPRAEYARLLATRLGMPYRKNDEAMYDRLAHRQGVAIRNAKRLFAFYDPCRPHLDNPSTTVHVLVQELISQLS